MIDGPGYYKYTSPTPNTYGTIKDRIIKVISVVPNDRRKEWIIVKHKVLKSEDPYFRNYGILLDWDLSLDFAKKHFVKMTKKETIMEIL